MQHLSRIWLIPLLFLLALSGAAWSQDEDELWTPTPPRLSYIDGEVSYWREGAEDWVDAPRNLPLAEGDALYAGKGANFEVQFDSRAFARADEMSELSLLNQEEHFLQFKVARGRVSFDIRGMAAGDSVEIDTPDAVFSIEQPGYCRVEVGERETRFITRRGGRATVTTADGRSLSIYPSEEIVITAGDPVQVTTYAAPPLDAWDRWNYARSERFGESVSARYLPADVYGAEDLDHYGSWRVVPDYGAVWIPRGVAPGWVPYSTGYWVWDPYYEWTWIDYSPWGWAPFHYGRWVYIGSYWAWAPGPVVRRPVYCPALVAFLIRDHDVSVRVSVGLPGLWWVALSWGEPVLPWWGPPRHRWHPRWAGWGGPRIVNNVVITQTTVINVGDIHFHNARQPQAIRGVPADKFGRERIRVAAAETRYRPEEFAPLVKEMPVKPSRASLSGGAPKAAPPPREVLNQSVLATRRPREKALPWQEEAPRAQPRAMPESRYLKPPEQRREEGRPVPQRPPFGAQAGPERTPPPPPPRLKEVAVPPPAPAVTRGKPVTREAPTVRKPGPAAARPAPPTMAVPAPPREAPTVRREVTRPAPPPPPASRTAPSPPREAAPPPRREIAPPAEAKAPSRAQPLPGKPANQTYRGQGQPMRGWEEPGGR